MNRLVGSRLKPFTTYASKPAAFGRFQPEVHQPVRQADLRGTDLDKLRAKREMLKSMTAEQALQVIEWHNSWSLLRGFTFFEAVELARRENKIIVPNLVHDKILRKIKDEDFLREVYSYYLRTGTVIIFEERHKPFLEQVVFTWKPYKTDKHLIFDVPEQFRGLSNCALVVEHPDFDLVNLGNDRYELKVTDMNSIHLINDLPDFGDHWSHEYDRRFRVPCGKALYSNDYASGMVLGRSFSSQIDCIRRSMKGGVGNYVGRKVANANFYNIDTFGVALF